MAQSSGSWAVRGVIFASALIPVFWTSEALAACTAKATDLIAEKTTDVGNVNVCNDGTNLTVTYETTYPWCLLETHLQVATSVGAIPRNKKLIPEPDRFDYGNRDGGCLDGPATFEIPLSGIGDDDVVIAAYAKVSDGTSEKEAWGDGIRFVAKGSRATYFTHEKQRCGGDKSKCVFVTSTVHTGNLGGLAGADAICNARAGTAGLEGTFKAWLSTIPIESESAVYRLTHSSEHYRLVDGTIVATDWDDLTNSNGSGKYLEHPINMDENGVPVTSLVWTGTAPNGGGHDQLFCQFWEGDLGGALVGQTTATDEKWTWIDGLLTPCTDPSLRLYCFQQ